MFGFIKKATNKATNKAAKKVVDSMKDKAIDAVQEVKDEIVDAGNDILPYFIVGGVILIGIALVRRQPPITIKVVLKQG